MAISVDRSLMFQDLSQMLEDITDYHRRIRYGIAAIRRFCVDETIDVQDLQNVRSELVQISRARSRFINEVVIPRLLLHADSATGKEIKELQNMLAERRKSATDHVARWTPEAIVDNRVGYCSSASSILLVMEDQISEEDDLLKRYLKRVEL